MGSLRESEVRVKSAALNGGGEGIFIAPPQKLVVAEVLCACRNFRHRVGTSDQFIFKRPRGFCQELYRTSEKEGRNFRPMIFIWPRTLCRTKQDTSDGGSELPTPTEFSGLSARVCLVTFIGLLASILDTLASPNHGFASLLIVRCFLYSNSKIEINKTLQRISCTVLLANLASILALFNFNDFKSSS